MMTSSMGLSETPVLMHFDFKVFHTVSCHLELAEGSLSTARNRQKNSEFLRQALDDKDSDITW